MITIDLTTLLGVAALITLLAQWMNNSWKLSGWGARVRTWVVGILLGLTGMKLGLGIFAAPIFEITWIPLWLIDSILGFCAALIANLGYDKLPLVKAFLELVRIRVPVGDKT